MFIKIVPLKNLPPGLDYFDYKIPKNLEEKITVGQIVEIPFRNSSILGVIFKIENKGEENIKIKEVKKNITEGSIISLNQIHLALEIAKFYRVSVGVILKMMLPPLQKRKLQKINFPEFKKAQTFLPEKYLFIYKNEDERKNNLNKITKNSTLILVPEKEDLKKTLILFSKEKQKLVALWHSELSPKEQFDLWFKIRNGEKTIIIGTRGAIFLPIPNLQNIVIDKEHHEGHKHWDQTPKFHTKDIAFLNHKVLGTNLFLMSYSPSSEFYYFLHKKNYNADKDAKEKIGSLFTKKPKIVNMTEERKGKNFSFLSSEAEDAILSTQKDVFVYINRRGFSRGVICADCGYIEKCPKCQIPLTFHATAKTLNCHYCKTHKDNIVNCSECQSINLKNYGVGTETIEKEIKEKIQNKQVIRIDKDEENPTYKDGSKIIVGTSKAIKYVDFLNTELIIFVNLDTELNLPEFGAQERVWHTMADINYSRNEKSKFLVQTFNPSHFIFKSLNEPDRFYRMDLNSKKALSYPPYSFIVKYVFAKEDKGQAEEIAQKSLAKLKTLTNEQKKCKLIGPFGANPPFYRNRYVYVVLLNFLLNETAENRYNTYTLIEELNKFIPNECRVDPNPISLLSP